ncbi:MAG: hypothetical protein LBH47_01915 [Christensenellaceae bacterium]|nr:hypothetical protein [Christensenellaceae bacterium]
MDEAEAKKLIEHMNETANFLKVVAKELSGNIESRSRSRSKSNGDGNGDFNILNKIESKSSGNGDFNILNKIDGKTI